MLTVIGIGTALWVPLLSALVTWRWLCVLLGIVVSVLTLLLVYLFFNYVGSMYLKQCRSCGGNLETVGRGWYDNAVPQPAELVIYMLALALPLAIAKLMRFWKLD